jgi:hypothetical protein
MRAFLEKTGSPFYMTSQGRGVLPDDHPYAHLTMGNDAFREADLIIILGTNYVIGYALPRRLSAQVKVARIDIDPRRGATRRAISPYPSSETASRRCINCAKRSIRRPPTAPSPGARKAQSEAKQRAGRFGHLVVSREPRSRPGLLRSGSAVQMPPSELFLFNAHPSLVDVGSIATREAPWRLEGQLASNAVLPRSSPPTWRATRG